MAMAALGAGEGAAADRGVVVVSLLDAWLRSLFLFGLLG